MGNLPDLPVRDSFLENLITSLASGKAWLIRKETKLKPPQNGLKNNNNKLVMLKRVIKYFHSSAAKKVLCLFKYEIKGIKSMQSLR